MCKMRRSNDRERHHQAWAATKALDLLRLGVVLVDEGARLVLANGSARRILGDDDGLRVRERRLVAGSPNDTRALHGYIRAATNGDAGVGNDMSAMAVPRPSMRPPLSVVVTPIHHSRSSSHDDGSSAVVFVSEPDDAIDIQEPWLRQLYGFSRAEASVSVLFVQGKSPKQMADELHVSVHTARAHLKQLLSKTGSARQQELMRLLVTGPAGRILGSPLHSS